MKKLSIITINLNDCVGLNRTIDSVKRQLFNNFEFIIIDGGSTDGSLIEISKNAEIITYWISETDNGIYHAMNKGIKMATGEYCLFLNSGDWLTESTILEKVFSETHNADIISGDIYFYDNVCKSIKWHIHSPEQLTAKTLFLGTLPHQASFIKRRLFDSVGLYNEELIIAADWQFFVEALLEHKCTYHHFKGPVAYFSMNGISCDPKTNFLPRQEQLQIIKEKYPLFLADYEQLDQLEKKALHWCQSREYKIYNFLRRIGIINLGLLGYSIKDKLKQHLNYN